MSLWTRIVFSIYWKVAIHIPFQEDAVNFVRKIVLLTIYCKVAFMVLTNFCSIYIFIYTANDNDLSYTIKILSSSWRILWLIPLEQELELMLLWHYFPWLSQICIHSTGRRPYYGFIQTSFFKYISFDISKKVGFFYLR